MVLNFDLRAAIPQHPTRDDLALRDGLAIFSPKVLKVRYVKLTSSLIPLSHSISNFNPHHHTIPRPLRLGLQAPFQRRDEKQSKAPTIGGTELRQQTIASIMGSGRSPSHIGDLDDPTVSFYCLKTNWLSS